MIKKTFALLLALSVIAAPALARDIRGTATIRDADTIVVA